jgi:anti-anti-sigma factor
VRELTIELVNKTSEGVLIFRIGGMLGVQGSTGIQRLFDACLGEGAYSTIFVMEDLEFISSAGVGAFISVAKEIRAGGGDVVFVAMPPRIHRVFESLDLLDYFQNFEATHEALGHFKRLRQTSTTTTDFAGLEPEEEVPLRSVSTSTDVLEFAMMLNGIDGKSKPLSTALAAVTARFKIPWMTLFGGDGRGSFIPLAIAGQRPGLGSGFRIRTDSPFIDYLSKAGEDFLVFHQWSRDLPPSQELDGIRLAGTQGIMRLRTHEGIYGFICFGPSPIVEGEIEALSLLGQMLNWFVAYHRNRTELANELDEVQQRLTAAKRALDKSGRKLARKTVELKTIFSATQEFTASRATKELLGTFLITLIGQLAAAGGAAFLVEKNRLNLQMVKGVKTGDAGFSAPLPPKMEKLLMAAKRPLPLLSLAEHEDGRLTERLAELGMTMVCGLTTTRDFLGLVAVGPKIGGSRYDSEDLQMMWTLSRQLSVALENARLFQRLEGHNVKTIRRLIAAIDARDPYTRGHSERVSRYVAQLAEKLGLERKRIQPIVYGAILHDVGMIATLADATLQDTVNLSEEELQQVHNHPAVGADILAALGFEEDCVATVRQHHERYDGGGYPDGLSGAEIHLGARMVAIADSYDTMVSGRRYQQPKPAVEAFDELNAEAAKRYDPELVETFVSMMTAKAG